MNGCICIYRRAEQNKGDEMEKTGYNGWTNYETWNLKLWLDNEEYSQREMSDKALELLNDNDGDEDTAKGEMSQYIEQCVEDNTPELEASFYSDILNAAIREVNWYEIAESYIEAAKEEYPEDCKEAVK
jgi:hypothetical protein